MRLRIRRRLQGSIDGVAIDHFQIGPIHEIRTQLALERLCEHCPDLVLPDLNMPVMDVRTASRAAEELTHPVESTRSLIVGSHEPRRFPARGGATCDTE